MESGEPPDSALIRQAGGLWSAATRSPFLDIAFKGTFLTRAPCRSARWALVAGIAAMDA